MTKSELIERLAQKQTQLAYRDVELAVKTVLEHMVERLANGERIEIRGFGSFSLHFRPGRIGRNPKTGAPVALPAKHVPHFKPGKELRERVDTAYAALCALLPATEPPRPDSESVTGFAVGEPATGD